MNARTALAAFVILLVGCWMIPGGSDDFRMDALVGRQVLQGESPHVPVSELGGTVDVIAFRTPIAIGLAAPFGVFSDTQLVPIAALFVAATGVLFLWALNRPWWWAFLIFLWPFAEVDRHGKWTFLIGALLVGVMRVRDPMWGGLLLALAVGINLWPAVIAVGLLVSGRWRTAVWSGVWFVGLSATMLATSVSLEGTVAALSQDPSYSPFNLSSLRWWPWWTIPLGVVLYALVACRRDPDWAVKWGVPVGLALSPVLWPAYLPVLAVSADAARRSAPAQQESSVPAAG